MNKITKFLLVALLCVIINPTQAQDTLQNNKAALKMEKLQELKRSISEEEKALLKAEVERINQRLEKGELNREDAEALKRVKAKKRALNIENRTAIVDNEIALLQRNGDSYVKSSSEKDVVVSNDSNATTKSYMKTPQYDRRTSTKFLFALGFNNAIIDGQNLEDSPYKVGGSGFVELGWLWNTRVFKNTNFVRINYGLSLQWNKLNIKDNQHFVTEGEETRLETFPLELKKAKFRTTSLVVPVHFEFGPSTFKDYGSRIRYYNDKQFKVGLGGFAGLNVNTMQKLKYKENGKRQKTKDKQDFNTNSFVYGVSGYIGVGEFSLYAKYNLNPLFKDQDIDQQNISLGLRWELN